MKLKLIALGLLLGAAVAGTSASEGAVLAQPVPTATSTAGPGAATAGTVTTAAGTVSTVSGTVTTAITPVAQSGTVAQPAPTRPAAPTLAPTARPGTTTTTTPRAGGFPIELAIPLLASGAAALGGGVYMLRRGRRG